MISIDEILRHIAQFEHSYVVVIYDSCRNRLSESHWNELSARSVAFEPCQDLMEKKPNLITVFACQYKKKTRMNSTMTGDFFCHIFN